MSDEKLTKEEIIKESSNYLRGTIKDELNKNSSHFGEVDSKLLKFHGTYQQDNRDSRQKRLQEGLEKEYSFMIRTKLPGGQLTSKQYIGLDNICNQYSNKTLRITTRQTIQFHGVIKSNLKKTLQEINDNLITTYGACGDVVRNVVSCPVCDIDSNYSINLNQLAKQISDHFLPNTRAYYEIWIDEEKIELPKKEPIYGKTYLPRKFKIGLILPNDNCVDIFTQDIGIIAITEGKDLKGFNLLVGGGLGHHHNKPETYPRLASELGFVSLDKLLETIEKIVLIQRDLGGRTNRKHARLKYLIDDNGLDWFKGELEKRIGFKLEPSREITKYKMCDHLGWHKQKECGTENNNLCYLGLFIENGRIQDTNTRKIKSGLREIIERFTPGIRLTTNQNIILTDIKEQDTSKVNELLDKNNIYTKKSVSNLRRNSMACPALPTCGLALAEAERTLPDVINELEKLGFKDETISIRMSGCLNSCSRPPAAEVGIIGNSTNKYNVYLGGDLEGTRLNKIYKENISGKDLALEISKVISIYKKNSTNNEKFGDFCNRTGKEKLLKMIN